jgi:hypothetical protein
LQSTSIFLDASGVNEYTAAVGRGYRTGATSYQQFIGFVYSVYYYNVATKTGDPLAPQTCAGCSDGCTWVDTGCLLEAEYLQYAKDSDCDETCTEGCRRDGECYEKAGVSDEYT